MCMCGSTHTHAHATLPCRTADLPPQTGPPPTPCAPSRTREVAVPQKAPSGALGVPGEQLVGRTEGVGWGSAGLPAPTLCPTRHPQGALQWGQDSLAADR